MRDPEPGDEVIVELPGTIGLYNARVLFRDEAGGYVAQLDPAVLRFERRHIRRIIMTETTHPSNRPTLETLDALFTYHPPTEQTVPRFAAINAAAKDFARVILENTPPSADQSAAIRLVRDARMTANASIALVPTSEVTPTGDVPLISDPAAGDVPLATEPTTA